VAFKGAVDLCHDIDLTTAEGKSEFELVFSFLQDSLRQAITVAMGPDDRAAEVIRGAFPGTTTESNGSSTNYATPPSTTPPNAQLTVKGQQFGPLPDWLYEQAAARGVTEVWDNRDRARTKPKYPWFKSTSGGEDAVPFWPPR